MSYVLQLSPVSIPSKMQKALANARWSKAIADGIVTLEKSAIWKLVPLPKKKKTMRYRWVFAIKHKADETVNMYKAQLVAKGYT